MLVCAYYCAFGTRDRGCQSAPGFPCALCFEGEDEEFEKLGQTMPRDRERILSPHVVPAKAGTHTPRRMLFEKVVDGFAKPTTPCGYWSLLSQGRHHIRDAEITSPSPARSGRGCRRSRATRRTAQSRGG